MAGPRARMGVVEGEAFGFPLPGLWPGSGLRRLWAKMRAVGDPPSADTVPVIEVTDEQDALTFRLFMERQLYNVQNVVYQHEHGLIDQDVFESTISQMRELLIETPGGSTFWKEHRHMYTEPMRVAVESSA